MKIISKENLSIFSQDSMFFSHNYIENSGKITAYYYYEVTFEDSRIDKGYIKYYIPKSINKVSKELVKLGALKNGFRHSHIDEDPCYVLEDINIEKLKLLKEIIYNQKERENQIYLDHITNNLIKNGIRPQTIINTLEIKDDGIFFNDVEILVHSISIKYPEKLNEISKIINEQYGEEIIQKKSNINNSKTNYIKVSENVLYYKKEQLFKNNINGKEYNIKNHGNYDIMMNLLIENIGKYVPYTNFKNLEIMNKSDSRDYNKKITDTKDNLLKNLRRNLQLDKNFSFIETNNGLKITLK